MPTEVKQLAAELMEAWNAHDIARLATFYAADYEGVDVGDARPQVGLDGIYQTAERYLAAFPDLQIATQEVVIEANRVAVAWTARGTHQGTLMHIPPTGRTTTVRGVSVLSVKGGKIVRGLHIWDVAGFLRALRLLPDLSS